MASPYPIILQPPLALSDCSTSFLTNSHDEDALDRVLFDLAHIARLEEAMDELKDYMPLWRQIIKQLDFSEAHLETASLLLEDEWGDRGSRVKSTGFSDKPDSYEVLAKLYSGQPGKLNHVSVSGGTERAMETHTTDSQSTGATVNKNFVHRADALLLGFPSKWFPFQGSDINVEFEKQPILMADLATQRRRRDAGVTRIKVSWKLKDDLPDALRLQVDDLTQSREMVTQNGVSKLSNEQSFMHSYAEHFKLKKSESIIGLHCIWVEPSSQLRDQTLYAGLRAEYNTIRHCEYTVMVLKEEYTKTYTTDWRSGSRQEPMVRYEYVPDQCETGVWGEGKGWHDAQSMRGWNGGE